MHAFSSAVVVHRDEVEDTLAEWELIVSVSGSSSFWEGDVVTLGVSGAHPSHHDDVESTLDAGGGWFGWIFSSTQGSSGPSLEEGRESWECVDATPPHAGCLETVAEAMVVADKTRVVGVVYAGPHVGGGGGSATTVLRVQFSQAVEPRWGGYWTVRDFTVSVGGGEGREVLKVLSVLETMEVDVVSVVVEVREEKWERWRGLGEVVVVEVTEGRVVGMAEEGKGRGYVDGSGFIVDVSE
ncbi:hypothetical protein HDU98_005409, partial [Podochytrium sp. JEL0797]